MSEQNPQQHHIRVRIDGDEFDAKGAEESVRADYRAFLEARARRPRPLPDDPGDNRPQDPDSFDPAPPEAIELAFSIKGGLVTIKLPTTEPPASWHPKTTDFLLMILWGYEHLLGRSGVPATTLAEAARTSGWLKFDRLDRAMSPETHKNYFYCIGERKATTYTLTRVGRGYIGQCIGMAYRDPPVAVATGTAGVEGSSQVARDRSLNNGLQDAGTAKTGTPHL